MPLNLSVEDEELYELNDALQEVIRRMLEKGQTHAEVEYGSLRVLWGLQLKLVEAKFGTRSTPGTDKVARLVEGAILNPKHLAEEDEHALPSVF